MRYLSITADQVATLKKQAKKLQRGGAGKHAELLDQVARNAGYNNWHHVSWCFRESQRIEPVRALTSKLRIHADMAKAAAMEGRYASYVVGADGGLILNRFVLFSTATRDAWLLDPMARTCWCLMWRGHVRPEPIGDLDIMYDGTFELRGDVFMVRTMHPNIGNRDLAGYPVKELQSLLTQFEPARQIAYEVLGADDTIELTSELCVELLAIGWAAPALELAVRRGARYSPGRNALVAPPLTDPLT